MTNSTLEKVARAISAEPFFLPGAGGLRGELHIAPAMARHLARKVLQSLRQVDDETVEAMADRTPSTWPWDWESDRDERSDVLKDVFAAAIDHILGQEP